VEAVLQQHPTVAQAAAFAAPSALLREVVAAAVVLRPHALAVPAADGTGGPAAAAAGALAPAAAPATLVEWCRARLAHYKVPSQVHVLEAMPTTGSGKVLKRQLRTMLVPSAATHAPRVAATGGAAAGAAASSASPLAAHDALRPLEVSSVGGARGLARLAATALGPGAPVLALPLAESRGAGLDAHACYVLPLTNGVALQEQVSAGAARRPNPDFPTLDFCHMGA
jgi:hypothetical protein